MGRNQHVERTATGHGAFLIERAEIFGAGDVQANFLEGFPDRRGFEIRVLRIEMATRKSHVARPGVSGFFRPLDEQDVRCGSRVVQDDGNRRLTGSRLRFEGDRVIRGEPPPDELQRVHNSYMIRAPLPQEVGAGEPEQ